MNIRSAFVAAALLTGGLVVFAFQGQEPAARSHSSWNWDDQDRKYEYGLVYANGNTHSWGSWNTIELRKLGGLEGDRLIVKKKDGTLYAITDRTTFEAAKKAIEPISELGRQQGKLGQKQGELGREQGKLGQKQGEIGREMGQLSRELGEIMRDAWKEEKKAEAEKRRAEYDRKMGELQKRMQDLSKGQQALGAKQGELGKQQGELGKRMGVEVKKADETITKLIDQAFEKGLAKVVN